MTELARRVASPAASCDYSYRLVAPLFEAQGLVVSAVLSDDLARMTTRDSGGRPTAVGAIGPAGSRPEPPPAAG
jgi:hypothetical protein